MNLEVELSRDELREKLGVKEPKVIEKIVERIEVVKEQPIVTNEIKEVAVAETPEEIRDKLEELTGEERLDVSAIKGLEKYDKDIAVLKEGRPIFGPGKTRLVQVDLSDQLDGVTKTFNLGLTHFGITGCWSSSSPFAWRPIIDYVESGKNIVFDATIDASVSLAAGQTLIVQCLK